MQVTVEAYCDWFIRNVDLHEQNCCSMQHVCIACPMAVKFNLTWEVNCSTRAGNMASRSIVIHELRASRLKRGSVSHSDRLFRSSSTMVEWCASLEKTSQVFRNYFSRPQTRCQSKRGSKSFKCLGSLRVEQFSSSFRFHGLCFSRGNVYRKKNERTPFGTSNCWTISKL